MGEKERGCVEGGVLRGGGEGEVKRERMMDGWMDKQKVTCILIV